MIIKPPKPGLGFGFWDLVWLGLGVEIFILLFIFRGMRRGQGVMENYELKDR